MSSDSWPKTIVMYLGNDAFDYVFQHPFHLGTDLKLAKEIALQLFEGHYNKTYNCVSLYLDGELLWYQFKNE